MKAVLFITLCGEVYLVIRDESCAVFFFLGWRFARDVTGRSTKIVEL